MRMWTKSACVVFALIALLVLLAVGMPRAVHQAPANTRIASRTLITLTAAVRPAASIVTAKSPAQYVVQPGDTLSAIAARFAVRGGWPALYKANRASLGPDPNVIQPGSVLVLPGKARPVRYTVRPGDTLSAIAAALQVPGGWAALYAANRHVIGTDPGAIEPGTVLIIPRQVASVTAPGRARRVVRQAVTSPRLAVPPPAQPGIQQAPVPVTAKRPLATGMPRWLVIMLLGVALLSAAAFLAEPIVILTGRRRKAARQRQMTAGSAPRRPSPACREDGKLRIVIADYDRLVVTQRKDEDTVYVLRPPGEDPVAVLRVARLVLRELYYQQLADHLHVSVGTQTGGPPEWGGS
jgi:LysM repeat protein